MTEVVVFLPGIMGSELKLGDERIWPGSTLSLIGPYKKMQELLQPNLVATDIIRSFSITSQYDHILGDFRTFGFVEGRNLVLFPYDWRKSNIESAGKLADTVDQVLARIPDAAITIVAHSMGGLIARYFLESGQFGDRKGHAAVRALITLGTPHQGAPLALSAAVGNEKRLFLSADQVFVLANDPRYPSLYQLLPPPAEPYSWDGRIGSRLNPIDVHNPNTAAALGLVAANLDAARAFRAGLDFTRRPAAVRYFLFYGTRQDTISASDLDLGQPKPRLRVRNLEMQDGGDGTVPVWSGAATGLQGRAVGGEHGTIYKNYELRLTLATLFGHSGTLAAEVGVEVSVRDRVVEPDGLVHASLSLAAGVKELQGNLSLERAVIGATGEFEAFVPAGTPQNLTYRGDAAVERLTVTFDAPELPGLYRLSFVSPSGAALGFDEFFVQEPA